MLNRILLPVLMPSFVQWPPDPLLDVTHPDLCVKSTSVVHLQSEFAVSVYVSGRDFTGGRIETRHQRTADNAGSSSEKSSSHGNLVAVHT